MLPSNHEEADTILCLHVADAVHKGATNVIVSTVDTDVVVILVGTFCQLTNMRPGVQLWVSFEMENTTNATTLTQSASNLEKINVLRCPSSMPLPDATQLAIQRKGGKSCWEAWDAFPLVTKGFAFPMTKPFEPLTTESPFFQLIEAFACVLYVKSTTCEGSK